MGRKIGVGNILEALVWLAACVWLAPRWWPASAVCGLAALLQGVGGLALIGGRGPGLARWASVGALVAAAALIGGFAQGTAVIASRFGAEGRDLALATFGGSLAAVPWLVGFPLWQVLSLRGQRPGPPSVAGLALLAGGLCAGAVALQSRPAQAWSSPGDVVAAAAAARARWTGGAGDVQGGEGPAVVLLTPWHEGKAGDSKRGDGPDLAAAISAALEKLPAPQGPADALVLDVARERYDGPTPLMPGESGWLGGRNGRSPTVIWRPRAVTRRPVVPLGYAPTVDLQGDAARFDSAVADALGARRLVMGWSEAPALAVESTLSAALAGARMLIHHQDEQGRFAYIVGGPSGDELGGYNFPRHAGVTWFLARVAERTGDAAVLAAAHKGLDYLVANTTELSGGRAYTRDPTRKDRKVWVGTTALAVLAAVSADHPVAARWGRFVADSVGPDGIVRGELDLGTESFPEQDHNPYGQGQVTLALASLVRAGHEEFRDALVRTSVAVDGGYAPGAAGRLVVLDEHWACLAALATQDVLGHPAGWEICRAYVANSAADTPTPGSAIHLASGPAGGLAEAVVAAAVIDPDGPWRARALAFADLFLRSAYQEGDAPFLGHPEALLGGFRDGPGDWDVRMDAVQHIGCALLGAEALLSSPRAGSLP